MNYRTYSDLSILIRSKLSLLNNLNVDLVVGIPRSGMVSAYMIGLHLNVNIIDFNSFLENKPFQQGSTRKVRHSLTAPHAAKKILIVDDSVLSGNSIEAKLKQIPNNLRSKIVVLVAYGHSKQHSGVDIVLELCPAPRVFEWNVFHRDILSRSCVDIDGVLCADPTEEENDDGVNYLQFLQNAESKFLPSYPVSALVTNRLEKYRLVTEAWLHQHGVVYDNLYMLQAGSQQERLQQHDYFKHKADIYSKREYEFFIESSVVQAQEISNRTGKPVFCVDDNLMITPGFVRQLIKPSSFSRGRLRLLVSAYLPMSFKKAIRKWVK